MNNQDDSKYFVEVLSKLTEKVDRLSKDVNELHLKTSERLVLLEKRMDIVEKNIEGIYADRKECRLYHEKETRELKQTIMTEGNIKVKLLDWTWKIGLSIMTILVALKTLGIVDGFK